MPAVIQIRNRECDRVAHTFREFSQGLSLANETSSKPLEVGDIVNALLSALNNQARAKPHGTVYASLGLSAATLITLVFAAFQFAYDYGALNTRVTALEAKTQAVGALNTAVEVLSANISALRQQLQDFEERTERTGRH